MGKTLMDNESKDRQSSKSKNIENLTDLSVLQMRKLSNTPGFQNSQKNVQSLQNVHKDGKTASKSRNHSDQLVTPSAPPCIMDEKIDLIDSKEQQNSERYVCDVTPILTVEGCHIEMLESSQVCDKGQNHSQQNKMTSFENDSEGFIEEIQVSKVTDWMTSILTVLSMIIVVMTFPFSMLFCLKIVAEYERAVVLRMGRLLPNGQGTKGPGLFFILPCIDTFRTMELRTVTFSIPPQEVLTRDSVTVAVDAVVYYRICNPAVSFLNVEDAARSTRLLAQTTLRNVLGTKDLAQILMEREEMSTTMQSTLDSATEAWGVKVERVEIKDVRLPVALQRAMAAEAEATREARARVIAAKGEHRASTALKEAAMVISSSPIALQLRYLQTMCAISAEKNSTIIFPLPIDILQTGELCAGVDVQSEVNPNYFKQALVKKWLPTIPDNSTSCEIQDTTARSGDTLPTTEFKDLGASLQNEQYSSVQEEDYDTYSDSV